MKRQIPIIGLILSLLFAYAFTWLSFSNDKVFWYFYTFTILFLMSVAFFYAKIDDKVRTLEYLFLGIGFGVLAYGLIAGGYKLIEITPFLSTTSIDSFLSKFGPASVWHYLLLLFFIAPGEELFWRGYIQQQLKRWVSPIYAIIASSALFGFSLIFSGFWLGILGAFVISLLLGLLYEWKKSMPLIILAHITMLVLLFLVLPLS
ncbi:CPBP family intramembrane glutamic endopeptidase [Psychrobacillus vulpis]|uniref:CPBP family intramembrane metalloprotease n=1 Tax=Psychrobacillus vulpis TaxID=2325572 RepID=A0A544TRX0_9BACI|nr:type II CAAX endopeptidase family protein [Psychrobacillus vulpis]TQR20182.1 CPBP family intramembrane metalloprotease [Psychrobacillus vulpis]